MSSPGWEVDSPTDAAQPACGIFVDAARVALTTGRQPSYTVGSLGPAGVTLDRCPPWITT